MSTDDDTAQLLAQALTEEAARVDPDPGGLKAIQRRTATSSARRNRRSWVLGASGAGLATAAVITAVVLVSQSNAPQQAPGAGRPSGGTVQQGPMHSGVYDPNADPQAQMTMYYVGPEPAQASLYPRLYAEPHTVASIDGSRAVTALHEFLTSTPIDPDYASGWPAGVDVSGITHDAGVATIHLIGHADVALNQPVATNRVPPHGSPVEALLATAALEGKVAFTYNGTRVTSLMDEVIPGDGLERAPWDYVHAWISIDNIVDGQTMATPFTVLVSGNVFEGNVNWQLLDAAGQKIDDGFVTTTMGSWKQVGIDLGSLDPGTYTFRAFESSAKDGSPTFVDDKAFTVE